MDKANLPLGGVFLFYVITINYLALFIFLQIKLAGWQKKKGRRLLEEA